MISFDFAEVEKRIEPGLSGLYMIHLRDGLPLKVGIATDLRRRLRHHRQSPDSGLRLKAGGDRSRPEDVKCSRSILGKHLYYDEAIGPGYDLRTEAGRQRFLQERCVVSVQLTPTRAEARGIERTLEASGGFRYVGAVRVRTVR